MRGDPEPGYGNSSQLALIESHNPRVVGSSPTGPTFYILTCQCVTSHAVFLPRLEIRSRYDFDMIVASFAHGSFAGARNATSGRIDA